MSILQIKLLKDARFDKNKDYDVLYKSTLDSGYTDVTSLISGWHTHGSASGKDYKYVRKKIQDLITDFDLLSSEDQILAGEFMAPDPSTIEDSDVLGSEFQTFKIDWIAKSKEARMARWDAAILIGFNLITDAKTALSDTIDGGLHIKYIEGIDAFANDGVDGVFDFVESTSTYSSAGLISGGYTPLNPPQTMTQISVLIMDILRNGNY